MADKYWTGGKLEGPSNYWATHGILGGLGVANRELLGNGRTVTGAAAQSLAEFARNARTVAPDIPKAIGSSIGTAADFYWRHGLSRGMATLLNARRQIAEQAAAGTLPALQSYYGDINTRLFNGKLKPVARAGFGVAGELLANYGGGKLFGLLNRGAKAVGAVERAGRLGRYAGKGAQYGIQGATGLADMLLFGTGYNKGTELFDYVAGDAPAAEAPPRPTPGQMRAQRLLRQFKETGNRNMRRVNNDIAATVRRVQAAKRTNAGGVSSSLGTWIANNPVKTLAGLGLGTYGLYKLLGGGDKKKRKKTRKQLLREEAEAKAEVGRLMTAGRDDEVDPLDASEWLWEHPDSAN